MPASKFSETYPSDFVKTEISEDGRFLDMRKLTHISERSVSEVIGLGTLAVENVLGTEMAQHYSETIRLLDNARVGLITRAILAHTLEASNELPRPDLLAANGLFRLEVYKDHRSPETKASLTSTLDNMLDVTGVVLLQAAENAKLTFYEEDRVILDEMVHRTNNKIFDDLTDRIHLAPDLISNIRDSGRLHTRVSGTFIEPYIFVSDQTYTKRMFISAEALVSGVDDDAIESIEVCEKHSTEGGDLGCETRIQQSIRTGSRRVSVEKVTGTDNKRVSFKFDKEGKLAELDMNVHYNELPPELQSKYAAVQRNGKGQFNVYLTQEKVDTGIELAVFLLKQLGYSQEDIAAMRTKDINTLVRSHFE